MSPEELKATFTPVLEDVAQRSCVADRFIDKNVYRLYITTLWANVVLNPEEVGIQESDLESLHEMVNLALQKILGADETITECFRFINSKLGEAAMKEAQVTKTHRELLLYFSSMILDPEGHKRWMESIADRDGLEH